MDPGVIPGLSKKQLKKLKYRTDYVEPIKSRREQLKEILLYPESKRRTKSGTLFYKWFEEDLQGKKDNIFGMTVDMMKAMPDRTKTAGQKLADWYLEDFADWLERTGKKDELRDQQLNPTIKVSALRNCTANQKKLIGEVFAISAEELQQEIKDCTDLAIAKYDFSAAAEMAIDHNLVDNYRFDQLVLPLVLTNKLETAYLVMAGKPHLYTKLLGFLDQFINITEREVEDILMPYRNSHRMTGDISRFVSPKKLINTVLEKACSPPNNFDLNAAEIAPRSFNFGGEKHIKHEITKRFDTPEGPTPDESYFQSMADQLKATSPQVRERIMFGLFDNKRNQDKQIDAICWALYFKLQDHTGPELPGVMKDFFKAPDYRLRLAEELLKQRMDMRVPAPGEKLFAPVGDKKYPIQMVTDGSKLELLCSVLKNLESDQDPVYLGFDSEWKPNHTPIQESKIALMQLFFREEVWLVDCVALELEKCREETWLKFAERLLKSNKIKVIGFDLKNDMDALLAIPGLHNVMKAEDVQNMWCLKRLAENVCEMDMKILELERKTFKLSDLTERLLGEKLNKKEQCSNWRCRPLRSDQIVYAATDAVVVVKLFEEVLERTKNRYPMTNVEQLMDESNVMAPKREKSQKEMRKMKMIPWQEIYETLQDCRDTSKRMKRPYDIKIIVDTMLLGFGKNLRRIGVDVYVPRDITDFRDALKDMSRTSSEYQRTIITVPSKSYEANRADYGDHMYAIPDLTTMSVLNQLIAFSDLFNIDLRPDDVMLRCMECNSRLLVKFPGPVINFLHQYNVIHLQNTVRNDMNGFPLEDWWIRMQQIDPEDYEGLEVEIARPTPDSDWIVATVPTGCLHITRNTVIHNNIPEGVEVRIHKVPDDVFKRDNICFYLCGDCGTVSYDGHNSQ